MDTQGHLSYNLRNATVKKWPFPHFFIENVFPEAFYWEFSQKIAGKTDYKEADSHYYGRQFGNSLDLAEIAFMQTTEFMQEVGAIFFPFLKERYKDKKLVCYSDLRLVRDGKGYQIGPHTDAPWKLVSLLFYLPQTTQWAQHGTSIYLPNDPAFRCFGGPHMRFEDFKPIYTAPFLPNSCFGFLKTDNSFHGVAPIQDDFERNVLLYNLYDQELFEQFNRKKDDEPASAT